MPFNVVRIAKRYRPNVQHKVCLTQHGGLLTVYGKRRSAGGAQEYAREQSCGKTSAGPKKGPDMFKYHTLPPEFDCLLLICKRVQYPVACCGVVYFDRS
jgi:hypothetical protein